MKLSYTLTTVAAVIALLLSAGCNSIYQEEVRPVRTYSKNYFFHVVRYQGETLTLISRWYTGSEKNATELRRQNRYIAGIADELPVNSRILIPRRLLQTMKLMPVGFIRKNSPDLEYELPEEKTPTPNPVATKKVLPTSEPTRTPAPTPSSTPTTTPEPSSTPTLAPTPTRTAAPLQQRPRQDRQDFSDEDPSESPNSQIQIPQDIVDELKNMGPASRPKAPPVRVPPPPVEFEPPPAFEPEPPRPQPPVRQQPLYEDIIPEQKPAAEPTLSDERKRLLERLRGR